MSVNQIMGLIPHRYPFLFVDYVSKIEGSHVTGVKNTTESEPIFRQYKDGYTVLMGAVQAEIIAQVGAIYMLSNENNKGKIAYFMGIDKSEMFAPVFPGDQLRLEVDIPDGKQNSAKAKVSCMSATNWHPTPACFSQSSIPDSDQNMEKARRLS